MLIARKKLFKLLQKKRKEKVEDVNIFFKMEVNKNIIY